jgi:hypothetical protein
MHLKEIVKTDAEHGSDRPSHFHICLMHRLAVREPVQRLGIYGQAEALGNLPLQFGHGHALRFEELA